VKPSSVEQSTRSLPIPQPRCGVGPPKATRLLGAGFGDPCACRSFPLQTLSGSARPGLVSALESRVADNRRAPSCQHRLLHTDRQHPLRLVRHPGLEKSSHFLAACRVPPTTMPRAYTRGRTGGPRNHPSGGASREVPNRKAPNAHLDAVGITALKLGAPRVQRQGGRFGSNTGR
jgi:hypothetical protein